MGRRYYQLYRRQIRKTFFRFDRLTGFQKRIVEASQNAGRGNQGVGTITSLFVLGLASALVATTIQIHIEIHQKQSTLLREFENDWNR